MVALFLYIGFMDLLKETKSNNRENNPDHLKHRNTLGNIAYMFPHIAIGISPLYIFFNAKAREIFGSIFTDFSWQKLETTFLFPFLILGFTFNVFILSEIYKMKNKHSEAEDIKIIGVWCFVLFMVWTIIRGSYLSEALFGLERW